MTWARQHPSDIPSHVWNEWLDTSDIRSPYLLPQWSIFWERLWKDARSEVWCDGNPGPGSRGIIGVRRRAFPGDRFHSQPFGTWGGFLGSNELPDGLWDVIADRRTFEVTLNLSPQVEPPPNWKTRSIESTRFVLDASMKPLDEQYSDSHKRNIRKGGESGATIVIVKTKQDAQNLVASWDSQSRHKSRIVLNQAAGALLASVYAESDAMVWWTAIRNDRPVATCLWLVHKTQAVYVDGAMRNEQELAGVNHWLFASILTELHSRGVTHFDFGAGPGGTTSEGLAQFKRGWGAEPVLHRELIARRTWYHVLRTIF